MTTLSTLARPDAAWTMTLYPTAGEAGGSFRSSMRVQPIYVPAGQAADPERARQSAVRRARAQLRRYAAANRLDRLGTLTYAPPGCGEPQQLRQDTAEFFRRLRTVLGGKPFPYIWVPERHKSGLFHVHFAVGQFIRQRQIEDAWGHGFVSIKRLSGPPIGGSPWQGPRIASRYMAKYVAKDFEIQTPGLHRYEVAQGFQPPRDRVEVTSAEHAIAWASEQMRAHPTRIWSSDQEDEWLGPPSRWLQWG